LNSSGYAPFKLALLECIDWTACADPRLR
jgi:hypothetical protein